MKDLNSQRNQDASMLFITNFTKTNEFMHMLLISMFELRRQKECVMLTCSSVIKFQRIKDTLQLLEHSLKSRNIDLF